MTAYLKPGPMTFQMSGNKVKSDLAWEIAVGVRCPDCKEKFEECKCESHSPAPESAARRHDITWTSPTTGRFQAGDYSLPFEMPKDSIEEE